MSLDSKAHFSQRLVQVGLGGMSEKFKEKGWQTMADLAFACSFSTKGPDDAAFQKDILVPLLGEEVQGNKSAIRRLYFEAFLMASNEMSRKGSRNEEDEKPKKLPIAERGDRLKVLQQKLGSGLKLKGEYEPSFALVDKFVEMQDTGELRFVPWSELTKRDMEVEGDKKDEFFKEDSSGFLKRSAKNQEVRTPIKELLHLRYALQRRGVAMNVARLLSFEVHERLVELYFEELSGDQLWGHSAVTMEQVMRCDKEVFRSLARHARCGISEHEDPTGAKLPLDDLLLQVMKENRITQLLLPRQSGHGGGDGGDGAGQGRKRKDEGDDNFLREENKRLRAELAKGKSKGSGKVDTKGKGKSQEKKGRRKFDVAMPKELHGMTSVQKGRPVCFDYNMRKGCTAGSNCSRGDHVCAFPGCGESHPCHKCPKRNM